MLHEKNEMFPQESHIVQTEDGYLLTLKRVGFKSLTSRSNANELHKNNNNNSDVSLVHQQNKNESSFVTNCGTKLPVLFVHGVQASGNIWLLNHPDNNLPYTMARNGHDCWVANLRGTPKSRNHVTLKNTSTKFWDFSCDEMGYYDVPAMIDYILKVTNQEKLFYIGHSMGCSVFFIAMTSKPEYNSKIQAMIAFAPAVHLRHIQAKCIKMVAPIICLIGKSRMLRRQVFGEKSLQEVFKKMSMGPSNTSGKLPVYLARKYAILFDALNKKSLNKPVMQAFAADFPASTSMKVICHGMQCVNSKEFAKFDYGATGNFKAYGQTTPPKHDLSKVTCPVATFYSHTDRQTTAADVMQLSDDLPNLISSHGICHPIFSHADFVLGKNSGSLVNERALKIIQEFSGDSNTS